MSRSMKDFIDARQKTVNQYVRQVRCCSVTFANEEVVLPTSADDLDQVGSDKVASDLEPEEE